MSKTRVSLMVGMSPELKEAIELYAGKLNRPTSEIARAALAQYVGYDLSEDGANKIETRGRPKQYESREARRAAGRDRRKAKRAIAKAALAHFEQQDAAAMRDGMAKAVAAKDATKK